MPFRGSISLFLTEGIEVKSGESLPHPLLLYQCQSEILGPVIFKRHCRSGSLRTPQNEFVLNLGTEAGMDDMISQKLPPGPRVRPLATGYVSSEIAPAVPGS